MEGAPPPLGSLELCPEVGLEDRWSRMLTPAEGPGHGRVHHKRCADVQEGTSAGCNGEGQCGSVVLAR